MEAIFLVCGAGGPQLKRNPLGGNTVKPEPPILFVRPSISFWIEHAWSDVHRATLQAFQEGCFRSTWCYDVAGGRWPIGEAVLVREPRLLDRLLSWRFVPVSLRLGARTEVEVADVVAELNQILAGPAFDYIHHDRAPSFEELTSRLRAARSPAELIGVAEMFHYRY